MTFINIILKEVRNKNILLEHTSKIPEMEMKIANWFFKSVARKNRRIFEMYNLIFFLDDSEIQILATPIPLMIKDLEQMTRIW